MMNVVGHKGRYKVLSLTAVLMKIQVLWNVTLFCWVSGSGCLEGFIFRTQQSKDCLTLKIKAQ